MRFILLTILMLPLVGGFALAESIDVRFLRSVPLGETPLQTVTTADGQKIYVLTDKAISRFTLLMVVCREFLPPGRR